MRRALIFPVLFLLLLLPSPALAAQQGDGAAPPELGPPMSLAEAGQGTLLLRTDHPGVYLPAPTLETEVTIAVTGPAARAELRQRFHNPTDYWLEGIYVFPLPETAAVDVLRMIVGERVVEGEIHEREEARKVYDQAKKQGKKASLVEQERPNLFTTSVANIGPGEDIEVVIEYQEELRYDSGRFRLRFPMVVGPRFIPGRERIEGAAGTGWAANRPQVPDAERISPPVAHPSTGPLNPVALAVRIEAGLPLAHLTSPSHPINVEEQSGRIYYVELRDGTTPANQDFVLEWEPEVGSAPRPALFTQERDGETYHLLMVLPPPGDADAAPRLPRETIFVIDTSGSMAGASIRQARQALRLALERLQPEDHFNVIRFSNFARKLFSRSMPADSSHVAEAQAWVGRLETGGGTNLLDALERALEERDGELGIRQVIFITDGCAGNERELFRYVRTHLGDSRLFTVGIGSAPNSFFMRKAAQFGRGTFTYVGSPHEVEAKMGELFRKLESPVMKDIEVVWDDPTAESWPRRVGDLYRGEPIQVVAKLFGDGSQVKVSGWRDTVPWEIELRNTGSAAGGLDKLWARRKIAALMDSRVDGVSVDEVRRQVIDVALRYHLVSKYTSLVAVDVTATAPEGVVGEPRPLPVHLPAGWSYEHVIGRLPQTDTPAVLRMLLGILLLVIAGGLHRLSRGWLRGDGP
ncbi:MAG: marine proteobacterial sortase target protein [bacterium]|nr:marine proteobacterial sortase target protein [bacterium]